MVVHPLCSRSRLASVAETQRNLRRIGQRSAIDWPPVVRVEVLKVKDVDGFIDRSGSPAYDPAMSPLEPVSLPTMFRVRQTFPRTRLEDIPGGVRETLAAAHLPIKRGDTVAVGAGER